MVKTCVFKMMDIQTCILKYKMASAGKFNKHIDLWDAIEPENQEFLSREGVSHVFSQLTASASTPDLDTPQFTILKKKKRYEVRK